MKIIKQILFIAVILFSLIMIFSYIFPGKVKFVDNIRLAVQGPIMSTVGNIKLGDTTIEDGEVVENNIDITLKELYQFLEKMEPGDVFLTGTRIYASSSFIPGQWKHSGIYLGTKKLLAGKFGKESSIFLQISPYMNDSSRYVLDSNSKGVHVHPIDELSNLKETSYLIGFSGFGIHTDLETQGAFLSKAISYIETPYDFDMVINDDKRIYCSELIYHALDSINISIDKRTFRIGREIFTPSDLFNYLISNSKTQSKFIYRGGISKKDNVIVEH